MEKQNIDYVLIGSLDDIAWIYNIRGKDVLNNPVVISYGIISKNEAYLFVDKKKINSEVRNFLDENNIQIAAYEEIIDYIKSLDKNSKIYLDKK